MDSHFHGNDIGEGSMRLPRHYVPRNERKCFPLTPVSSTGQALTLSLQERGEKEYIFFNRNPIRLPFRTNRGTNHPFYE